MSEPTAPPLSPRSMLDLRLAVGVALLAGFTVWSVTTFVGTTRTQSEAEQLYAAVRRLAETERVLESAPPADPEVGLALARAEQQLERLRQADLGDPTRRDALEVELRELRAALGPEGERTGRRMRTLEALRGVQEDLWALTAGHSRAMAWHFRQVALLATSGILMAGVTLLLSHVNRRRREAAEELGQRLAQALSAAEVARAEALRASAAKSQFLATVSHEIRTPMTAILGTAELLSHTPLSSRQADCVAVINSGGETLLNIINDVLDLSRIEAGRLELRPQPFALGELLDGVVLLFAGTAESRELALTLVCDPALPEQVLGDVTRLRQALVNLVGNALKFTERGEVAVRCAVCADKPGWVRFEVRDTGVGIPAESLGSIFETFSTVSGSRGRGASGTGLGLSITRRLVEAMDGELTVRSAVGLGSVFTFTARLPELAPPARPPQSGAVVVLGDDPSCRAIVEQLGLWGVEVALASGPVEAEELAAAREDPFALALIGAPGTTDLGERLSALHILRLVPFRAGEGADALGADGVCVKPVRPTRLRRALAHALEGAPSTPALRRVGPIPRRLRVLVVDDNRTNLLVLGEMLRTLGYAADLVDSGSGALERLERERFDLVFMDCDMPDPDGLETTRRLRARDPQAPPVVGLSGHATDDARRAGLEAGMSDYLGKPVRLAQLQAALERWAPAAE